MPKRGKAHFLVACGTSIATSTMVAEILREDLVRQKKYNIEFYLCKTSELIPKVELLEPDVIISTAPVKPELINKWREKGILFFKGTPFLTGIGVEPIMKELISVIDTWNIQKIKHSS
jgi:galactitol-specific phosphotransferase system IIB component